MAEGQGHSVGTLYIDVVPRLNQAAMQQVAQQAQGAAGGRGGFGGGGTTVGGPGMPFPGGPGGGPVNNTVNTANSVYNYATSNAVNQAYNTVNQTTNNAYAYTASAYNAASQFFNNSTATTNSVVQNIVNNTYNRAPANPAPRRPPFNWRHGLMTTSFLAWELGQGFANMRANEDEARLTGNSPLANARLQMKSFEGFSQGIVGSIARLGLEVFTDLPSRARENLFRLEQQAADFAAGGERDVARRKGAARIAEMRREARRDFMSSDYERGQDEAKELVDKVRVEIGVGRMQRMNAREQAIGTPEWHRANAELDRFNKEARETLGAAEYLSLTEQERNRRDDARQTDSIYRRGGALAAAAQGRAGAANALEFMARQADAIDKAREKSPAQLAAQRYANRQAAAAQAEQDNFDVEGWKNETEAIGLGMSGNPIAAFRRRAAFRRKKMVREAPFGMAEEAGALADAEAAEGETGLRRHMIGNLYDRASAAAILANDSSPYGPTRASIDTMWRRTMSQSNDFLNAGMAGEAQTALRTGANELRALGNEIARGIKAYSVSDLGSVDAFTDNGRGVAAKNSDSDPTQILKDILTAIKALGVKD